MNLPNKLTILRVCMIPFFVLFMECTIFKGIDKYIAAAIFIAASITDTLDGKIARKYDLVTNFGKFMDPLADKLLVTAALLVLLENGLISGWVVFVILAREFIVTGFRTIAASKGVVIAAGWLGKIKTVVQFMMISTLLLLNYPFEIFNWPVDRIFIALAVVLTVASGVEYIYKNLHIFDEAK